MKNAFGQDISVGSVVTPGRRRTPNRTMAIGVVVHMDERERPILRTDELAAKVRYINTNGQPFTATWNVQDLIVIDEMELDNIFIEFLDNLYLAYMLDANNASDFVPQG